MLRTFMLAVTGLVFGIAACSSYGTSVVEVDKGRAQVASVSLTVPASLEAGKTARGIATPKDANGTVLAGRAITWHTSSASIAMVDDSGMISAVAPGSAVLSAAAEGVEAKASVAVVSPTPAPVASVLVSLNPSAVVTGQTAHATATLKDSAGNLVSGRAVTWESSDTGIATVTSAGDAKAVGPGSVTIKASSEGKSSSAVLSVSAPAPVPVATISVSPATASLQIGATVQLSAVTRDANNNILTGRTVSWTSSNPGSSTVSSSGLVTALAAGTASITASSEGNNGSATVTVTATAPPPVPVASVSVSPATAALQVGGTVQLTAVTRDGSNNVITGRVVSWSSSNTNIASVNSSGVVTALAAGSATIIGTSEGKSGSAALTVTLAPVASVTVSPATATVSIGQTTTLSVTLRDAAGSVLSGRTITWTSDATGVATVINGLVTGIAAGTAKVTATSEGVSGTSTITVPAPAPPPPAGSAPEPGAGDVMLLQDDFNRTSVSLQLAPYGSAGSFSRVDGHSGDALRVSYNSGSWNTNTIDRALSSVATDAYYRYWYRLSVGADATCGGANWSGFKWFMAHRPNDGPRYTNGVSRISGGPTGFENIGTEFSVHDNSSVRQPNPFMSNINKTKRFNTTNDGQWHKYTLHIVTGNGGYEQIWIDDVLVLDSQAYGYDHSSIGIDRIALPGTMVQWVNGCDFTVDIDDIAVWHR